ncbi:gastrula zinc finger protein XlCGF7.1-like [Phlebotomus papatasi]|uniref:gastrula zinc finger protein XlCGF7.1-like n=1 Tax=Phlebotomus papatasi TaxID=29031 RepID=UPI0024842AF2|nr:gastrula zinc finger protein XlCGF7.1-like [Phlebotomus papatasi]
MDIKRKIATDRKKGRSRKWEQTGMTGNKDKWKDFTDLVEDNSPCIKVEPDEPDEPELIIPDELDEVNALSELTKDSGRKGKNQGKKRADSLRHKCTECNRSYAHKCHLNRHMNSHYPKYSCKLCNKTYVRSYDHKTHMKMHKNRGAKPYKCEKCDKGFTRKENLKVHLLLHQFGKRFTCSLCKRKFSTKMNRDVHMNTHSANHKSQRILECAYCGKICTKLRGMMFHMKVHMKHKPKNKKES